MKFEIILNEIFDDVKLDDTLSPTNNKSVLGLINDFEMENGDLTSFKNLFGTTSKKQL